MDEHLEINVVKDAPCVCGHPRSEHEYKLGGLSTECIHENCSCERYQLPVKKIQVNLIGILIETLLFIILYPSI